MMTRKILNFVVDFSLFGLF